MFLKYLIFGIHFILGVFMYMSKARAFKSFYLLMKTYRKISSICLALVLMISGLSIDASAVTPTGTFTELFSPTITATMTPTWTPTPTQTSDGSTEVATVTPVATPTMVEKVYFVSNRDGNNEIYRMNLDGSNWERITYTAFDELEIDVSPDSSKIAFSSTDF